MLACFYLLARVLLGAFSHLFLMLDSSSQPTQRREISELHLIFSPFYVFLQRNALFSAKRKCERLNDFCPYLAIVYATQFPFDIPSTSKRMIYSWSLFFFFSSLLLRCSLPATVLQYCIQHTSLTSFSWMIKVPPKSFRRKNSSSDESHLWRAIFLFS